MRVDAHQHFWARARGDYGWLETIEAVRPIRKDYYPADFEAIRARYGIDRTVLVQAAPSLEETEYMLGLADATPWIAKVVGWVDFEDATHRRHLERREAHLPAHPPHRLHRPGGQRKCAGHDVLDFLPLAGSRLDVDHGRRPASSAR